MAEVAAQRARATARDLHVLRYVIGESPIHRCWAGSKILAITILSLGLVLWPTWEAAGLGAVLVFGSFLLARLPGGVLPRLPRWLWWLGLLGAVLSFVSGGRPRLRVAGLDLGVGGIDIWARLTLIGIEILALAALVAWTTPLADLAPALGRLAWPLRRLRLPIDELIAAIALGIRCLPLLLEEVRVLAAARRTRRPGPLRTWKERADALEDLIYTALSSALRRARELAEAIEARGSVAATVSEQHGISRPDLVLLGVSLAAVVGMALLR